MDRPSRPNPADHGRCATPSSVRPLLMGRPRPCLRVDRAGCVLPARDGRPPAEPGSGQRTGCLEGREPKNPTIRQSASSAVTFTEVGAFQRRPSPSAAVHPPSEKSQVDRRARPRHWSPPTGCPAATPGRSRCGRHSPSRPVARPAAAHGRGPTEACDDVAGGSSGSSIHPWGVITARPGILPSEREAVRLAGALQGEVLDEHRDPPRLGETHHVHQLGKRSPVRCRDGALVRQVEEVDRHGPAAEADDGQVTADPEPTCARHSAGWRPPPPCPARVARPAPVSCP